MVPVDIDEPTLKKIAEITGGKYFRATDNESLQNIYKEIDKLEKTKVSVQEYSKKREEFMPFAVAAAVLLLLELLIRHLVLRHNP
jgi:Ca-activated chloride channel family protein